MRTRQGDYDLVYGSTPYIIAECGVNHNGCRSKAEEMVAAAKQAGADCVKFQLFTGLLTTEHELLKWYLSPDDIVWLAVAAKDHGIDFLVTPFSVMDVELLMAIGQRRIKLSHRHQPDVWAHVAKLALETFVSASTYQHLIDVRGFFHPTHTLYATPEYPTHPCDISDRMIAITRGLSDHTPGIEECVCACRRVDTIEKHLKLDDDCFEAEWSVDPKQFAEMVTRIRELTL